MNEYVVYWRREVLYRSKIICYSKAEAMGIVNDLFDKDLIHAEEIDELGPIEIDNAELLEENVDE